jgi:hypothetical protein
MKVKVFQTNNQGKIEFTRAELEKLLNEMYTEGYKDGEDIGRSQSLTWTTPYINPIPYCDNVTYTTSTTSTAANNDKEKSIDKPTCANDATNLSIEKKNIPMSYSINLDNSDVHSLSKAVNEIITNASRGVRPSTGTLSAFDALAKELNF